MLKHIFIDNQHSLCDIAQQFKKPEIMYFDTEFHRRNTYWSTLCLIQLKLNGQIMIIDTQNVEIKNTIIAEFFADPSILKVCHACEQDLNALKHAKIEIENCFDTQIGAAFCRFGHGISYQNLTKLLVDINLEKKYQDAIWCTRPLTEEMIEYAKYDVVYLDIIFDTLRNKLKQMGRYEWVQEEVSNIKYNPKKKSMLHLWRDKLAKEKNLPPGWIINNKTLHAISCTNNHEQIKSMLPNQLQMYYQEILDIINANPKHKEHIDNNIQNALQMLIKIIAEEENIPANWICNSEQIRFICANHRLPDQHGWRYSMLNEKINNFLNGKIGVFCKNDKMYIQ